jgi:hypothetical protein
VAICAPDAIYAARKSASPSGTFNITFIMNGTDAITYTMITVNRHLKNCSKTCELLVAFIFSIPVK